MSGACVSYIDREKRVVWVSFVGRGDELEGNLRGYGVEYVPAFRVGRVGLPYYRSGPEDKGEQGDFSKAATALVEILTQRTGITKAMEERFAEALSTVQDGQALAAEAIGGCP